MSIRWTVRFGIWAIIAPILWQIGAVAVAQDRHDHGRSGYSERPSPNDPLEDRQRRFQRSEGVLKYLDTNQNGQIEANEVEGSRKYLWDRMAQRLSLQSNFPYSVSKLREGLAEWYYLKADQIPASVQYSGPGGPGGPGGPSSSSMSRPSGPIQPSGNTPGVSGFGASSTTSSGSTSGMGSTGASSTSRPSASGFGSGSSSSSSSNVDERIRVYAQSLLRQYDTNKNGILERDEWRNMRGDYESADTNRDGNITLDELTAKLASYSRGSSPSSSTPTGTPSSGTPSSGTASTPSPPSSPTSSRSPSPPSGSPSSSNTGMTMASVGPTLATPYRRPNRTLSAKERLPRGLPDWFSAKDANADGQVSMGEYSSTWSDATAQEFRNYDLNGDGLITPAEALKAAGSGR